MSLLAQTYPGPSLTEQAFATHLKLEPDSWGLLSVLQKRQISQQSCHLIEHRNPWIYAKGKGCGMPNAIRWLPPHLGHLFRLRGGLSLVAHDSEVIGLARIVERKWWNLSLRDAGSSPVALHCSFFAYDYVDLAVADSDVVSEGVQLLRGIPFQQQFAHTNLLALLLSIDSFPVTQ
ncbi:hypothetical protein K504DRAFT_453868 [Pleomassaria siparia CBS 279.74]|uniref:Uncharacterized protein n=1 Tax=Pleomassaria siparia CBS 279.74 TaxID=1314801 RepID=A0A6G1KD57_9PLEO|nr:hypothetical protein K504DRAFT_453868 [Pleomassaria siparia CBS 279.74]